MKNRNLFHSDDWATPPYFYEQLNAVYNFNFDPCPLQHDISKWDGLQVSWKKRNFINPPYDLKLKTAFIEKAIAESKKSKLCVCLLPVSTSTDLFHNLILPNADGIIFLKRRVTFIGVNSKGQYVNWHLWEHKPPADAVCVKSSGQQDNMLVIFNGTNIDYNEKQKEANFTFEMSLLR